MPTEPNRPDSACRTIFDIPYAGLSASQKLDLYLPVGRKDASPLLITIHGGAFRMGDKRQPPGQPPALAFAALQRGYALAALNYRLSQEAIFPACVQDVKTAVRWLRAHAEEYRLDPQRFAAWGDSAGGYLVAMLATSCGVPELEGSELGYAQYSSGIQAAIDWYGPTDFLLMDRQLAESAPVVSSAMTHDAPDSPESELMGFPIQEQPERVQAANPIHYLRPEAPPPPCLIYHGTLDKLVPVQQSRILRDALLPLLGPERLVCVDTLPVGHGGEPDFYLPEHQERMLAFLDRYLGKRLS